MQQLPRHQLHRYCGQGLRLTAPAAFSSSPCGFRPGRGGVDQIFNLRRTLEHRGCFQQPTVIWFFGFATALDSIIGASLWKMMEASSFPPKLLPLIKAYYRQTKSRVRTRGSETIFFRSSVGSLLDVPFVAHISWSTGLSGVPW